MGGDLYRGVKWRARVLWRELGVEMVWWFDLFGNLCRHVVLIAFTIGSLGCWAMKGSELILILCKR